MLKGYTTKQKIENYMLTEIDVSFDTQIDEWIESIENYIEQSTGRIFIIDDESPEVDTTKTFDGDRENTLLIDDCVSVSEVKIDDSVIDDEDYYLYPANSLPKTKIKLANTVFSKGNQNIEITGQWGYSFDVPKDIEFATTVLVAGIINNSLQHDSEIKSESLGGWKLTFKDENEQSNFQKTKDILVQYTKYTL